MLWCVQVNRFLPQHSNTVMTEAAIWPKVACITSILATTLWLIHSYILLLLFLLKITFQVQHHTFGKQGVMLLKACKNPLIRIIISFLPPIQMYRKSFNNNSLVFWNPHWLKHFLTMSINVNIALPFLGRNTPKCVSWACSITHTQSQSLNQIQCWMPILKNITNPRVIATHLEIYGLVLVCCSLKATRKHKELDSCKVM